MHVVKSIALAVLVLALAVFTTGTTEAAAAWDGGTIRVEGLGIAPTGTSGTQAEALARRAAISDAYRQLAEQTSGVRVDAVTTVENLMLANMTVRTQVRALIKGAAIVEEKQQRDGSYTVTIELPVYGAGSLASTIFAPNKTPEPWTMPESVYMPYKPQNYDTTGNGTYDRSNRKADWGKDTGKTAAPTPLRPTTPSTPAVIPAPIRPATPAAPAVEPAPLRPTHPTPTTPAAPAVPVAPAPVTPAPTTPPADLVPTGRAVGGYTGVIIDCTGLGLRPVMSPVIKAENGRPIYGYKNLDSDKVVQNGMASYARSEADATRAGTNPLRLRAVSVDGNANPVLSAADANRLLLENSASGFLDATNVVFLR